MVLVMGKPQRHGVSYARFSSRRQATGSTLRRQKELLEAYLRANPDITLLEQYSDKGVSGFRGKHATEGELGRFLEAVKLGRLPTPLVLIIESIDRLSREQVFDAYDRFSSIIKAGVTVAVCDMGLELDHARLRSDPGQLSKLMGAMQRAHDESQRKSDLVSQAWNINIEDAKSGRGIKGYVGPPWVTLDKATMRYVITPANEPAIKTVEKIFGWAADRETAHGIAKRLNESTVPVFRAHRDKKFSRNGWYPNYVTKILRNRQVLGEHSYRGGEVIRDYFPAIISPELFHQAQQAVIRRQGKPGRKGKELSNLFTGVGRCAHCGGHMQMTRNREETEDGPKPIKYLVCSNRKRRHECKATGMINYFKLEETILDRLPQVPWSDIIREENSNDPLPEIDTRIATVTLEIAELITNRDNSKKYMLKGGEFLDVFEKEFLKAKAGLKDANARLAALQVERAKVAQEWGNRPGLVTTAVGYRDAMSVASEAERLSIRTRLSDALREMITDMRCDTLRKTVIITYGDRWELHIAMPIRRAPLVSHRWTIDLATLQPPKIPFEAIDRAFAATDRPEIIIKQVRPA